MPLTITQYRDVATRANELGLNQPSGFALLPRNFEVAARPEDLLHESTVQTVRILLRQNGIQETKLEKEGQRIPTLHEKEFSLLLPGLFIGMLIWSGNQHLVAVALNVISNYATDFFKGVGEAKKVKLDIIVQTKNKCTTKKIHYEGDPDGLKELAKIAQRVFTSEDNS